MSLWLALGTLSRQPIPIGSIARNMPTSGDRMSRTCQEAYRLSQELYRTYGHYQPSPFRAWTAEDMAWLAGADGASGHYIESSLDGAITPPEAIPAAEHQLSLF